MTAYFYTIKGMFTKNYEMLMIYYIKTETVKSVIINISESI